MTFNNGSTPIRASCRIAHLDMDAFYASVELLRYPELKGMPVAIGGRRAQQPVLLPDGTRQFARLKDYVGRGVLTTATYEARALGIHSGMGTMKAAKLAPDTILLPVDFDAYRHYSRLFKASVATVAPKIEDRGIDEIYIDLTDVAGESRDLAQQIKRAVLDATGLTCSIGITPNKLLSKICSDLQKPDGITILGFDDIPTRIWPLPVRKINGIGPKATEKLAGLGIITIADLAAQEHTFLMEHFGRSYGAWLYDAARGIDDRPIVTESDPKSVSRETTFERDLHPKLDRQQLGEVFTSLCQRVAGDLQRKGMVGRTVGIKLRFEDFHTVTRDLTLPEPTDDPLSIRRAAGECLKRIPLDKRLRLLGVKLSALTPIEDWKAEHPPSPQAELFLDTASVQ
jgi:DNA polymerase-4